MTLAHYLQAWYDQENGNVFGNKGNAYRGWRDLHPIQNANRLNKPNQRLHKGRFLLFWCEYT